MLQRLLFTIRYKLAVTINLSAQLEWNKKKCVLERAAGVEGQKGEQARASVMLSTEIRGQEILQRDASLCCEQH